MANITKEQLEKAQRFIIKALEEQPKNKIGLQSAINEIEEEVKATTELGYKKALLVLAEEMNSEIDKFDGKNQSQ